MRRACLIAGLALLLGRAPLAEASSIAQFTPPPPPPSPAPTAPAPAPAPTTVPSPAPPRYEPTATAEESFGDRTLKGHTFLFPAFFDSAFIATYFGVYTNLRFVRVPDIATRFGTFDLHLTGASEGINFGVKLSNVVGLRFTGSVRAIVGTNLPSIVYEGATYDLGAGVEVPVRLLRSESSGSQLTLVPFGSFGSGQVTTLFPLLTSGVMSVTEATFLVGNLGELADTPFRVWRFGLSAAFAQTFSPSFALQLAAGLGRNVVTLEPFVASLGGRDSQSTGSWEYTFGAAFTADAAPAGFPIAGMAEWRLAREPSPAVLIASDQPRTTNLLAVGAYYSGRRDLQLGVIAAVELGVGGVASDFGESGNANIKDFGMIFRYFW
jgi:hypothetical protein